MSTKLAAPLALLAFGLAACGAGNPAPGPTPVTTSPKTTSLNTTSSNTTSPQPTSPQPTSPRATQPAAPLIDHVRWTRTAQGRELQVYPTPAGRTDSTPGGLSRAWAAVLADAADADTPGMYDQFRCHWEYARIAEPDKPSWNLEPWRPAVGYAATVAARCNPGGPET